MTRENTWAASQRGLSCVIFWPWVSPTGRAHRSTASGAFSAPDFCPPLGIRATRIKVAQALLRQNFIPIVDDRNCFCGIVTRRSLHGLPEWSGQIWRSWRHPRCVENLCTVWYRGFLSALFQSHSAVTFTERRHLVQTYTWVGVPLHDRLHALHIGFQARLERRWEWET